MERGCGKSERISGLCKQLIWYNGYTQAVSGPARGDALLNIFLLRPECSLISSNILPGISEHNGVLLEVEWEEICREPRAERQVPMYQKNRCFRLASISAGKVLLVGWKWQLRGGHMEKL